MLRIKLLICTFIICFIFKTEAQAQKKIFYGMEWITEKSVAIDEARSQGKQVFLLWGRTGCKNSQYVLNLLSDPTLKEIIEKNYVLWFCDCEKNTRFSSDVADYISKIKGSIALPVICIIDTYDVKHANGLVTGRQELDFLHNMLSEYVGNDIITDEIEVYSADNNLVIHNDFEKEIISVYSVTGSLIDQFDKTDYNINHSFFAYPKGLVFVRSSLGWVRKVYIR